MDDPQEEAFSRRAAQERLLIAKLSREDLEDKYLKVYDENIILKKHGRKQEEKIKKMATKLIRLLNDKKRIGAVGGTQAKVPILALNSPNKKPSTRDIDTEEMLVELQERIQELETQNKRLRENLQVTKIQLQTQKKSTNSVYSGVSSRIDTGIPKSATSLNSSRQQVRTIATNNYSSYRNNQEDLIRLRELEDTISSLQNQIIEYETQIELLNTQLREKDLNFEEDLLRLKNQVSQDQKNSVQENIEQIKLQRELKEKSNQYTELFAKFNQMTQQHMKLKENHDKLLNEIENYSLQIKREQQKSLGLKTEIKNLSQTHRETLELKETIEDLRRDNDVLKEANEKLLNSAFSLEREREFREREKSLKIQIAQLEATLKADVGEKGSILDKLTIERDQYDKLNTEFREMQIKYYEMKQKYDEMNEKVQFLSQEGNIDFKEIEEALLLVKERKSTKKVDFLNEYEDGKSKNLQKKISQLEAQIADTVRELDKSRRILVEQVKINEEYKREVHLMQSKLEENRLDYDRKLNEYASMLDERGDRIKRLEKQLKDIAYGTRQVKIKDLDLLSSPLESDSQTPAIANLERGQNIFEINVVQVSLTDEALKALVDKEPSSFCTIEFYEHEVQTSPVIKGTRPAFNFISQYVVKVDDFFLHYLQKEKATIEFHQAFGSDYKTLAACQLSFNDIIDGTKPSIHGTARLIGIDGNVPNFGLVEFTARLVVPVDQAFRLYKERTKALGYISSNNKKSETQLPTKKALSSDNMNEVTISILRCSKLQSKDNKQQPSAYCIYKFFDFNDHDTDIVTASNYPEFNDSKSYAVSMDIDLDKYLKSTSLNVYIFDDNQPENDAEYLGLVKIPLIQLAHNKDLKGTFEVFNPNGSLNGTIDVCLTWKYTYIPPSASASVTKKTTETKTKDEIHQQQFSSPIISAAIPSRKSSASSVRSESKQPLESPRAPTVTEDIANSTIRQNEDTYFDEQTNQDQLAGTLNSSAGFLKTDDEIIVTPATSLGDTRNFSDKVIIKITNFALYETSSILTRENIKQLFVGMKFLDYDPADLETPFSLPKPQANQELTYNFEKKFVFDAENNYEQRQKLASALVDQKDSVISFTIVSEPPNDEEECEDIAYCAVDIGDIFKSKRDLVDEKIELVDFENENESVGYMTVTIQIIDTLMAISNELTN